MQKKTLLFLITVMFISGHLQVAQASDLGHNHEALSEANSSSRESVSIGNEICLVSGEKIDEKMKATYEYNGRVYNFCCASCIEEFKKDPEKYIKNIGRTDKPMTIHTEHD